MANLDLSQILQSPALLGCGGASRYGQPKQVRVPARANCANPANKRSAMNEISPDAGRKRVVVYACSGCSDAGELADRTARALSRKGLGEMSCLAGIGGRVTSLINKAKKAEHIVAIDGCPLNCARHTLALAGFGTVHHLELNTLGFRKGSCPPTEERIAVAVEAGTELLKTLNVKKDVQT